METVLTGYYTTDKTDRIVSMIKSGGICVLPTDTIYGFHCSVISVEAVEKILRIKGRNKKAGLILLMSDIEMVDRYVRQWPGNSKNLLSRIWPARLTAILPSADQVSAPIRPDMAVAVRIPASDELRRIIAAVGSPIVSTSVNRSGMPPMKNIVDIRRAFPDFSCYISNRGRPGSLPSTIVDFRTENARLVRQGAFHFSP